MAQACIVGLKARGKMAGPRDMAAMHPCENALQLWASQGQYPLLTGASESYLELQALVQAHVSVDALEAFGNGPDGQLDSAGAVWEQAQRGVQHQLAPRQQATTRCS